MGDKATKPTHAPHLDAARLEVLAAIRTVRSITTNAKAPCAATFHTIADALRDLAQIVTLNTEQIGDWAIANRDARVLLSDLLAVSGALVELAEAFEGAPTNADRSEALFRRWAEARARLSNDLDRDAADHVLSVAAHRFETRVLIADQRVDALRSNDLVLDRLRNEWDERKHAHICPDCFGLLSNDGSCCDECGWALASNGKRARSARKTFEVLAERRRREEALVRVEIAQPIGNCDGSRQYAYDKNAENYRGKKLASRCPGCRGCT